MKAKQVEYLINSLPEPEPEEEQVSFAIMFALLHVAYEEDVKAKRLQELDDDMARANEEYIEAVNRASELTCSVFHNAIKFYANRGSSFASV